MKKFEKFNYKFYQNPIRIHSIAEFEKTSRIPLDETTLEYMCQIMSIIGLELESRFTDVVFDDDKFMLFGREKSENSLSIKRKIHIENFNKQFKTAVENGETYIPTKVKPIYDFYAFKLVCPHIEDLNSVINTVIQDILADIKNVSPSDYIEIQSSSASQEEYIDAIDIKLPDKYPGLKQRFLTIKEQKQQADAIQAFLDNNSSIDIASLTYKEYYQKITYCYILLSKLAYKQSYNELEDLDTKLEQVGKEIEELRYARKARRWYF